MSRTGLRILLSFFDLSKLLGGKHGFDLLQSRPMNLARLVMLLLIAESGVVLNGFSLIRFRY